MNESTQERKRGILAQPSVIKEMLSNQNTVRKTIEQNFGKVLMDSPDFQVMESLDV